MLNTQKGNMYGFVTHTWNTVKGKCPHDCVYCYMKRFPQKGIRFDKSELKTDLGKGNFIFVGSSNDMFAESIPEEWIIDTLKYCREFDNKYLFQSKNPNRFFEFLHLFPYDTTLCTTIETNKENLLSNAPMRSDRLDAISKLRFVYPTMITIEPVMDFDVEPFFRMLESADVYQINIGADSGNNHLPEPSKEKVEELIAKLEERRIKVFRKDNLKRLFR